MEKKKAEEEETASEYSFAQATCPGRALSLPSRMWTLCGNGLMARAQSNRQGFCPSHWVITQPDYRVIPQVHLVLEHCHFPNPNSHCGGGKLGNHGFHFKATFPYKLVLFTVCVHVWCCCSSVYCSEKLFVEVCYELVFFLPLYGYFASQFKVNPVVRLLRWEMIYL